MKRKLLVLSVLIYAILNLNAPLAAQDTLADNGRAWVAVDEVNVRETPNTRGNVLGQLTNGTELIIHGREDTAGNGLWVYVTPLAGGITGWALSDNLSFPVSLDLNGLPVITASGTGGAAAVAPTPQPSTLSTTTVSAPEGSITGVTRSQVNFRTGPSTRSSIIRRLPQNTPVIFNGRNAAGTWLRGIVDGQEGWLSRDYVNVTGDVNVLPVIEPATAAATTGGQAMPGVVPAISANARRIYLAGQRLGNRADVFSKVGDSITASGNFLNPIGLGGLQLHGYGYLQPVVDFFSRTPARTHNSFANTSLAARNGWTSGDLLDPNRAEPGTCLGGETPLACEYRLTRPSVALIMIGTNDLGGSSAQFRANLETIVARTINLGIIPVLSTIPDNNSYPDRVGEFNGIIAAVAAGYDIPLWNYWTSLQGLPGRGISGDGVHPSTGPFEAGIFSADALIYGYNMRNLTALMVLDAVWRGALY